MSKSQPRYPAEIPKLKNRSHAKILVLTNVPNRLAMYAYAHKHRLTLSPPAPLDAADS